MIHHRLYNRNLINKPKLESYVPFFIRDWFGQHDAWQWKNFPRQDDALKMAGKSWLGALHLHWKSRMSYGVLIVTHNTTYLFKIPLPNHIAFLWKFTSRENNGENKGFIKAQKTAFWWANGSLITYSLLFISSISHSACTGQSGMDSCRSSELNKH